MLSRAALNFLFLSVTFCTHVRLWDTERSCIGIRKGHLRVVGSFSLRVMMYGLHVGIFIWTFLVNILITDHNNLYMHVIMCQLNMLMFLYIVCLVRLC